MADDFRPKFDIPQISGKEVHPEKTFWQKIKPFFSPQVNAVLVGWALTVVFQYAWFASENRELKRELNFKMAEIQKLQSQIGTLTTEKASAESKMAYFSSLPFQVPTLVSNLNYLFATDPTNRQELATFLLNLSLLGTNLVNELESFKPTFDVELNGTRLEPYAILDAPTPFSLQFRVLNTSSISAEHLTLDVLAPLEDTNVLAFAWQATAGGEEAAYLKLAGESLEKRTKAYGHWRVESQFVVADHERFMTPPFIITNFDGIYLPLFVNVSADRSTKRQYFTQYIFKNASNYFNIFKLGDRTLLLPSSPNFLHTWLATPLRWLAERS